MAKKKQALTLKDYIKDVLERVITTFVEAFLSSITVYASIGEVEWKKCFGISLFAALISFCKCILARTRKEANSGSLVK